MSSSSSFRQGIKYPIGAIKLVNTNDATLTDNGTWIQDSAVYLKADYPELANQLGAIYASPTTPRNTSSTMYSIVYGNGLFVAGGNLGAIRTSTDGITWETQTFGSTSTIFGVAYGNGTFVAGGHLGVVRTSANGVTWTAQTFGSTSTITTLVYENNLFLAGGHLGVLRTSTDGVTWTAATSNTTATIYTIGYGNNSYIHVSGSGVVRTSTDAITWANITATAGFIVYDAKYIANTWFMAGAGGAVRATKNFVNYTVINSKTTSYISTIAYAANTFVITGTNFLNTSTDGYRWMIRSAFPLQAETVTYDANSRWVFGYSGTTNQIQSSNNVTELEYSPAYNINTEFYVPKMNNRPLLTGGVEYKVFIKAKST